MPRDIAYNQLDSDKIAEARELNTVIRSLSVVSETGSTNADLLSAPLEISEYPRVLLAEEQTQGRGRFWEDLVFSSHLNVYMSVAWCWDQPLRELAGISLALGASCVARLRSACREWPNDGYGSPIERWPGFSLTSNGLQRCLWIADQKVAGILTESQAANKPLPMSMRIGRSLLVFCSARFSQDDQICKTEMSN